MRPVSSPGRLALRRSAWLLVLLGLVACGGGEAWNGRVARVPVEGLAFPNGLAQPGPVQPVVAFPGLWFDRPVFLTAPPDGTDRIVVVEQNGLVRIFANDTQVMATTTYLDLTGVVNAGGEEGLLGFAFHPDYASNGTFYTYYTAANPRRSVVSRWQVSANPNVADATSEAILLQFDQPYGNHNAGALAFGSDGMLYIASGDGGSGNDPQNNAQDLTSLLGKVLRLMPDGSIPPDNPFVGGSQGERGEIWAYGLRNPWRMTFDRASGTLWLGDVGQGSVEELDIIERGRNYGWRIYEGTRSNLNPGFPPSAFELPEYEYVHALGASVTGGYVYRGPTLTSFGGAYVYADFVSGRTWALVHDGSQTISNTEITNLPNPASFGEDEAGELYACCFDGAIYRFQETGGGGSVFPATLSATGLFTDVTTLTPTPGLIEYEVNAPLWSDGARKRRWLALPGQARIVFHPTDAWSFPVGTVLVKHFEIDVAPGQVRRLETRVLLHHQSGWQGYTYRWNAQQTDADLLPGSAASEVLTIQQPGGGTTQQTWTYPSRADCTTCHTAAAGRVLGVRTRQLNRAFPVPDNQLRAWNELGLFTADIGDPSQYEALPDPGDASLPVAGRARAYLAANCAPCHLPQGPTPVDLDLRYGIAVAQTNTAGVPAVNPAGGAPSAVRITPGGKELSDLWERMRRRDGWGMPPLGSGLVDPFAVDLVGAWIDQGAN